MFALNFLLKVKNDHTESNEFAQDVSLVALGGWVSALLLLTSFSPFNPQDLTTQTFRVWNEPGGREQNRCHARAFLGPHVGGGSYHGTYINWTALTISFDSHVSFPFFAFRRTVSIAPFGTP